MGNFCLNSPFISNTDICLFDLEENSTGEAQSVKFDRDDVDRGTRENVYVLVFEFFIPCKALFGQSCKVVEKYLKSVFAFIFGRNLIEIDQVKNCQSEYEFK
ncbi:trimethylguanosine synthase protein [Trichinella spiralis]|uniref:trimethylguanosine synthase protein n=1 Tax=Trichinella spiralis TaxID=6334 RepID=UPI0001EFB450|nr:trimethylguanosine synthase protein [Trichinella spiralis]